MTYPFFDVNGVVVTQGKIVQGAHPLYIESNIWLAGSYLLNLLFADGRSETMGVVVQHGGGSTTLLYRILSLEGKSVLHKIEAYMVNTGKSL